MKTALVLGGGGFRGAYQAGFTRAIVELGIKYDIVVGTSIGALNGCLLAQNEHERLLDLWDNMEVSKIIRGDLEENFAIEEVLKSANKAMSFFKQFTSHKVDNAPLIELIGEYYNQDKLKESSIDYACVSVEFPSLQPKYATKEDMMKYGKDYLISSSACFPAFPIHKFDEGSFIDGGYHDNLPVDYAIRMGADNFIIVDLNPEMVHPHFIGYPNMIYIHPKESVGSFMNFDQVQIQRNIRVGYNDTMKAFGKYDGYRYTFNPYSDEDLFNSYYNIILKIESNPKVGEKMNNNEVIFKTLKEYGHRQMLSTKDLVYLSLDYILDYINVDSSYTLDFKEAALKIINYFEDALTKPLNNSLVSVAETVMKRVIGQDKTDILRLAINSIKFPEKYSSIELKYLEFEPLFSALANLIILLNNKYRNT